MRTYLEKNHLRCHLGQSVFNSVVTEFNLFKHDMKSTSRILHVSRGKLNLRALIFHYPAALILT